MIEFQNISIAAQGLATNSPTLLSVLETEINNSDYQRISACAAYASRKGVTLVRGLTSGSSNAKYRWLIGLDDSFTDPEALRIALRTHKAETRTAELLTKKPKRRFHPKAYLLDSNANNEATLIVGSNNLTERALKSNCEVFTVFRARTEEDVVKVQNYWEELWNIGQNATESIIDKYKERYKRAPQKEPVIQEEISEIPSNEVKNAIEESIGNSTLAWIEFGSNTGGGNQLDIVKNLSPFLKLPQNPNTKDSEVLNINTNEGIKQYQLTFTKGMWRFMNLQQGFSFPLRPDAESPSPFTLVIKRSNDDSLSMDVVTSKEAYELFTASSENGFIAESKRGTSGRFYGWF